MSKFYKKTKKTKKKQNLTFNLIYFFEMTRNVEVNAKLIVWREEIPKKCNLVHFKSKIM
jgi:hypothetical protein